MTNDTTDAETGVPPQFERNRYFYGKLMTSRDMAAEQGYHRGRLDTLARGVLSTGIVTGLAVTAIEERDGYLHVTVEPGVAIDAAGRSVIVPAGTGTVAVQRSGGDAPFPADEITVGESLVLTLRYDACSTERVPAAGNEHTSGDRSEYGRVVESFVVEAEADGDFDPPKSLSSVSLPSPEETETPDEAGRRIAGEFDRSSSETTLALAKVTKADDGWAIDDAPRPFVYPNDLVYAAAITHATDRDNPHGVDVGQVAGSVASVGGAQPDANGAIDVSSESGTVAVSVKDNNTLDFDTDALRSVSVRDAESISGDENGRVGLYSPDDSIAISTDSTGNRVGFRTAVDLDGVLFELQGLGDHDGAIKFVSSNDSVAVEQHEDSDDTLDVRVTDQFVERLKNTFVEEFDHLHRTTETLSVQIRRLTEDDDIDPRLHPVTVLEGLELPHATALFEQLRVVTLADLAKISDDEVMRVTDADEETANKWIEQAAHRIER